MFLYQTRMKDPFVNNEFRHTVITLDKNGKKEPAFICIAKLKSEQDKLNCES